MLCCSPRAKKGMRGHPLVSVENWKGWEVVTPRAARCCPLRFWLLVLLHNHNMHDKPCETVKNMAWNKLPVICSLWCMLPPVAHSIADAQCNI